MFVVWQVRSFLKRKGHFIVSITGFLYSLFKNVEEGDIFLSNFHHGDKSDAFFCKFRRNGDDGQSFAL